MTRKFTDIENSGHSYVYEHWRTDTNVCFWVGKGTSFRYRVYKRRANDHYNAIVAKQKAQSLQVEVRFVAIDLDDEEAFRIEIDRMKFWRDQGVILANKSAGGRGGFSGVARSTESRAMQSTTTKGRKLAPDHAAAVAERNRSPERRALNSKLHSGRKRPPETGTRISAALKAIGHKPMISTRGTKASEETKAKLRAAKTPEVCAKIAAAVNKQWENPEFRKIVSATMRRTNDARRIAKCAG